MRSPPGRRCGRGPGAGQFVAHAGAPDAAALAALVGGHARGEDRFGAQRGAGLLQPVPQQARAAGHEGDAAQAGLVGIGQASHGQAAQVGLDLQQRIAARQAAAHQQLAHLGACGRLVGLHAGGHGMRNAFEDGARQLRPRGGHGHARDRGPRARLHGRQAQAGERGDEDQVGRRFGLAGQGADLLRVVEPLQLLADPVERRSRGGHIGLDGIARDTVHAPRRHGQRAFMGRVMRGQLCSREHIDEAARAMHAQRLAPLQAAQAHGGRMLVARAGQDGHGQAQQLGARAAEVLHVLAQAGQQLGGKLQRVQPVLQVAVIAQRIGVARGHIGGRGDHGARIRQMPQQPGVDGAEGQAALLPGLGHGRAFAQLARGPQVGRTHAHGPARVADQPGIPVAGQ